MTLFSYGLNIMQSYLKGGVMNLPAGENRMPAVHPGAILFEEFMQPMELSANALAQKLQVTSARINEIKRGRRGISADTAWRLAAAFGTTAQFWLNLQNAYDLKLAQAALQAADVQIQPIAASTS